MKVKICGLTTLEDALAAVEAGADMLGFNFYPASSRYIEPAACGRIQADLQGYGIRIITIGVFVNLPPGEIRSILDDCGLDMAQLSGDEPPEALLRLNGRGFKAFRLNSLEVVVNAMLTYPGRSQPPAWLVDSFRPGLYGGSGHLADWSMARKIAERAPILLAGGLTPENVGAAIMQVRPWGVDVASGVESAPGRKDRVKMEAFIKNAKSLEVERSWQ